jgi:hypothetical protein
MESRLIEVVHLRCDVGEVERVAVGSYGGVVVAPQQIGAAGDVAPVELVPLVDGIQCLVLALNAWIRTEAQPFAVRGVLGRRSTELEGSRSTNATRADQVAYARGTITAAELRDRVWRRYNVQ